MGLAVLGPHESLRGQFGVALGDVLEERALHVDEGRRAGRPHDLEQEVALRGNDRQVAVILAGKQPYARWWARQTAEAVLFFEQANDRFLLIQQPTVTVHGCRDKAAALAVRAFPRGDLARQLWMGPVTADLCRQTACTAELCTTLTHS